ncbi:MAG: sigma-70 family RNA polymerase sigma factor [Kofleriaceae bacterium]|nr:sigma-70 family RNA polymerase sigma factor [Kofleriaceae bacterium]
MSDRRAEELLVHAGWLRALALRLVRDSDIADDLVQDTWIATMRRTPERSESAKSWLAKVMLNRLRMRARGEGRRTAREQATLLIEGDDVPTQDVLVARAETQRKLVELVLRLDEPYRTTVLLHFCEGVPLATIARQQGVPASTVRWRLKTALDRLREGLDAESGGRKQWLVPLLAIPKGVLVAQKTSKLVAVAIVLLLLLVGAIVWRGHRGGSDAGAARTAGPGKAGAVVHADGTAPTVLGADPDRPAWLIQPDVKPRRVAGRVTFHGAPVAGATVELASLATESGLGVPLQRTSSASGEFDFGAQPAMEFSVRASAAHHSSAMLDVDLRNPTLRPEHLELALGACDAAMTGTVHDASGGAIAKARIARLDLESRVPGGPAAVADENGAYELCVETKWPPSVIVEVSAAGYGTIVYTAIVPGRVKVDFLLVPEATIVGRVVRDDTREPVAQAYVWIPVGPPGVVQRTGWRATFSDASGHFRLDRVAPGSHLVSARAEGLADAAGVPVAVEAGQTSAEIEIRLEAGSTLRGTVVDGSKPVAGARVAASSRTAFSQDDGSYVLTGVPRGDVKLTAMPYEVVKPQSFHASEPLHDGVVIEVEAFGTITGRVVRGRDAISGAAVSLSGPHERELDPVRTDADGRFTARGLRPGQWSVGASSQQLGVFGDAGAIVQLARGETKDVTIELEYGASISGRVVDQNGAPVSGATVGFIHTSQDDIGLGVTAMDGSFRAAMMSGGGQYRPKVSATPTATPSKTALRPASGTEFPLVTLADGHSEVTGVLLAVKLERLAISGTVVDDDGAPVPDVRVVAEQVEGNAVPRFFPSLQTPASTTDVGGRFTISELPEGTYALRARSLTGIEGTLTGIRAGRKDVVFALPSSGGIDATIVGFKNPPQVTARPTDITRTTAAVPGTQQGNVVSFRNLAPGSYLVAARNETEGASALVEVVGRKTSPVTLTSKGSAVVAGRVREFRSGKPIQGMTCQALPRAGITQVTIAPGEGVDTDAQGGFVLEAPVGDTAVWCYGLAALYSDGMRTFTLPAGQRLEVDVPVVAWNEGLRVRADIGATLDPTVLVPRLVEVQPGGPAATAGFVDGDVITAVDGASVAELSAGGVGLLIRNRAPGTKVKIAATRGGRTITGELVLGPAQ